MAQVKIYGHSKYLKGRESQVSEAIHSASQSALGLPENKRFHRFFLLTPEHFIHPADRLEAYLILEIHLFQGRKAETLRQSISALQSRLQTALALALADLEITLIETPAAYWGIRGQTGYELQLNYEVKR